MKLLKEIIFASSLLSPAAKAQNTCNVNELVVPDNAEGWDCDPDTDGITAANTRVPPGTKCYLKCNPGFIDYICE